MQKHPNHPHVAGQKTTVTFTLEIGDDGTTFNSTCTGMCCSKIASQVMLALIGNITGNIGPDLMVEMFENAVHVLAHLPKGNMIEINSMKKVPKEK